MKTERLDASIARYDGYMRPPASKNGQCEYMIMNLFATYATLKRVAGDNPNLWGDSTIHDSNE